MDRDILGSAWLYDWLSGHLMIVCVLAFIPRPWLYNMIGKQLVLVFTW